MQNIEPLVGRVGNKSPHVGRQIAEFGGLPLAPEVARLGTIERR